MYLAVTLGLCKYKEFVLYPNNGVNVEDTVWLSKRNKTAKGLFVESHLLGLKIIFIYFPDSLAP